MVFYSYYSYYYFRKEVKMNEVAEIDELLNAISTFRCWRQKNKQKVVHVGAGFQ